jgi:hypothetical protein
MAKNTREYYVAVDSIKEEVYIATTKTLCAKWLKVSVITVDRWLKAGKGSKGKFVSKSTIDSLHKPWVVNRFIAS